ncbi:MAG: prepilin peptidase [Candidatus Schmidhempelia sp.]|nr:prepilin peptidase [Candidatus Schmidhempelia sp.]
MFSLNIFFFLTVPILAYICYTDIKFRKIYNVTIVCLLVLVLVCAYFYKWMPNWQSALLIFFCGLVLFYIGGIGAGDIKLLSVLSLSIPKEYILDFLLLVGFSGLPLILVVLIIYHFCGRKNKSLPYGVAICVGYFILHFLT